MKKIIISLLFFSALCSSATSARACCLFRCWRARATACAPCAPVAPQKKAGPTLEEHLQRPKEYMPAPPPVDVCPLSPLESCAEMFDKSVIGYVSELNALRRRYGLRPVQIDVALTEGAEAHSQHQAARGQIYHAPGCGAEVVAQNWGVGIAEALRQWLESPPHRSLILSAQFTRVGVGVCRTEIGANYCTIRLR